MRQIEVAPDQIVEIVLDLPGVAADAIRILFKDAGRVVTLLEERSRISRATLLGDVSQFVPPLVADRLKAKFAGKTGKS